MADTTTYQSQPPGLWSLYSRALLPKSRKTGEDVQIPELSAQLAGVSTANDNLASYRKVCGFEQHTHVPITWPHILAFPLHLKVLTEKSFPLPLLGLVHLRNSITQYRPIGIGEALDIQVRLGGQNRTDRGLEFDLITEASSAGRKIWEESSTTLFRQPNAGGSNSPGQRRELERYPNTEVVRAPESIGRQYASVSGDCNPIHMHALTAKAFGFPRAIAHGMWSKAHAMARLQRQPEWRNGAVTVSCQFKKPLFLPGTAQLNWQTEGPAWDYQLLNAKGDAPHLTGSITWE